MVALKVTLAVLGIFVILVTGLSFVRSRAWWIRIFDFPRAQLACLSGLVFTLLAISNLGFLDPGPAEWVLFALLGIVFCIHAAQMLPYTPLWRCQVPAARRDHGEANRLRLLVSNVCMKNPASERWLAAVRREKPHVAIAVEVDEGWVQRLRELDQEYPFQVLQPQDNTYGIALYSRFPLFDTEIRHLVEKDVPSVFTSLELPSKRRVRCVVLHPRPPRPDIQQDSAWRDAELVRAGRLVRTVREPVIVAGDLNDVAWSHTTHLFQKIARLLDPRIGRGLFATFSANHWYLRYPLDHVFHSRHFRLVTLRRLEHVGSDHFPMLVELALDAEHPAQPEVPVADGEEEAQADEAVQDLQEIRREETPEERRERHLADR